MLNSHVPTTDLANVPEDIADQACVLDVREQNEWDEGHIDGALHIPLMELPARLDDVPADQPVVCVCHSGARSAQATVYLNRNGREAVNLAGGMEAWQAAGRPLA